MKMASLMCTSLSLLVKVAPVSGQVKYTPVTERNAGSLILEPCKRRHILAINNNSIAVMAQ
jgi:diketogulonate reductase-like aldo/keto reductase